MDTLFWIFENFSNILDNALTNFFFYGFLASMSGLAFSIYLIKKGKKRSFFQRSNGLWTLVAKLNYVVMPIAFMLFFGFTGGIYGVHTSMESFIDETTEPILEYATTFLPEFHDFVKQNPNRFQTIEQAVDAFEKSPTTSRKVQTAQASFGGFGVMVAEGLLESMGKRADMVAPVVALSQIDINNIQRNDLDILPLSLKSICAYWMIPIYWAVFLPFFFYLLIAGGEFLLYRSLN